MIKSGKFMGENLEFLYLGYSLLVNLSHRLARTPRTRNQEKARYEKDIKQGHHLSNASLLRKENILLI
jgi:hypothetical protein